MIDHHFVHKFKLILKTLQTPILENFYALVLGMVFGEWFLGNRFWFLENGFWGTVSGNGFSFLGFRKRFSDTGFRKRFVGFRNGFTFVLKSYRQSWVARHSFS